jgi:hypothetical protein
MKQVENPGIVGQNGSSAVIAKILIEPGKGLRDVAVPPSVNNIETLSRVGVEKTKAVLRRRSDSSHGAACDGRWEEGECTQAHD